MSGDIVEDKDIIGQVIFSVGSFDVKVLKVKTNVGTCEGVQYPLSDYYDECYVIGNVAEWSRYGFEIYDVINRILSNDYIPKQKIKDEIEDLKISGGSDGKDNIENAVRELVIEVLQDILD